MNRKGFTLIELIICVILLSIFSILIFGVISELPNKKETVTIVDDKGG